MRLFRTPPTVIEGHTVIPTAFATSTSISAQAKLVYLSVAMRHQEGSPEAGEQELADENGLTLDEVRDAVAELDAISEADWEAMQP